MADYKIVVKNQSGASRAYFLFVERPKVTGSLSSDVYQNVYIAAPSCANPHGSATFQVYKAFYAVTGTSTQQLGANVSVSTGDYTPVTIAQGDKKGNNCFMTMPSGQGPSFDTSKFSATVSTPGAFEIACDHFPYPNPLHAFIGLGAQDPSDPSNIVPVATFDAQPATSNFIYPVTKYYISWGSFVAGEVIDVTTIATPVDIDFTGSTATMCVVTHNNDGTWTKSFN